MRGRRKSDGFGATSRSAIAGDRAAAPQARAGPIQKLNSRDRLLAAVDAGRQSLKAPPALSACDGRDLRFWKGPDRAFGRAPQNRGQTTWRSVQAHPIVGYGVATRQSRALSSARWNNAFPRFDLLGHIKRFWTKPRAVRDDELSTVPPVAPAHLRKRVHGAEDKDSFEDIGRIISDTVFSYLKVDDGVERFRGLDFGAGLRPSACSARSALPQEFVIPQPDRVVRFRHRSRSDRMVPEKPRFNRTIRRQ